MSFQDHAERGDALGAARLAIAYGALWAIGSSWSIAIREVTLLMLPDDTMDVVIAELLAAGIVTFISVNVSVLALKKCTTAQAEATPEPVSQLGPRRRPV
jgi:hypothetical protein